MQINRYDAEGLRYEMMENNNLVKFIFNQNREVIAEQETEWTSYIRGSTLLASSADHARTYYHFASDEMSSITHIVDDEKVLNEYEYDAWGEVVSEKETVKNRFKFNGQQLDPITQQYYLRARFYNPVIARFTQEDTYRGDGLNLYAYCRNNPVYYVDPTGNACENKADVYANSRTDVAPNAQDNGNIERYSNNIEQNQPDSPQADELVHVYRGTDRYDEIMLHTETGIMMSDAARTAYNENGYDLDAALETSQRTHNDWINLWDDENTYVQAHSAFGQEMPREFNMDRTLISTTTDINQAIDFARGGTVYEAWVPRSQLIEQTLDGAGESEFLIRNGAYGFTPIP